MNREIVTNEELIISNMLEIQGRIRTLKIKDISSEGHLLYEKLKRLRISKQTVNMIKNIILTILFISLAVISCNEKNINKMKLTVEIKDSTVTDESYNKLVGVLNNRFNLMGIEDASIKRININILQIEYSPPSNNYDVKKLIQQQGLIEFSLVAETDSALSVINKADTILARLMTTENRVIDSIFNEEDLNEPSDLDAFQQIKENAKKKRFKKEHPLLTTIILYPLGRNANLYVEVGDKDKIELILNQADIHKVIPYYFEFKFSATTNVKASGNEYYTMYLVNRVPELSGGIITDAVAGIDPNTDEPIVTITMNQEGTKEWAEITGSNINRRIAIIIDGAIFSAPVVTGTIRKGRSQVQGFNNNEEAESLAMILKSGMLPHPLKIINDEKLK